MEKVKEIAQRLEDERMEKVKGAILNLENQQMEYKGVEEELNSAHHILSEVTLSLVEGFRDGMNKFQIKEMYLKLNAIQQLLFYVSINMKKDNKNMNKQVIALMSEIFTEEDFK